MNNLNQHPIFLSTENIKILNVTNYKKYNLI